MLLFLAQVISAYTNAQVGIPIPTTSTYLKDAYFDSLVNLTLPLPMEQTISYIYNDEITILGGRMLFGADTSPNFARYTFNMSNIDFDLTTNEYFSQINESNLYSQIGKKNITWKSDTDSIQSLEADPIAVTESFWENGIICTGQCYDVIGSGVYIFGASDQGDTNVLLIFRGSWYRYSNLSISICADDQCKEQ